jgi:hypothetical protein
MPAEDMKITKWYVEVSFPNPGNPKYLPLCEVKENGHLRVANKEQDEILFFDTYIQAEDFAKGLNTDFGYYTRVMELCQRNS